MKIFAFILLSALALGAGAETVSFRSGRILNAEISSRPITIAGFDPAMFPDLPARRAYGAVTVMLNRARGLGLGDYRLEIFGRRIPCVAIRDGNGEFDAAWKTVSPADIRKKYTLLFIIDANQLDGSRDAPVVFAGNYPPERLMERKLLFRGRGNSGLTAPGSIPVSGRVTEVK